MNTGVPPTPDIPSITVLYVNDVECGQANKVVKKAREEGATANDPHEGEIFYVGFLDDVTPQVWGYTERALRFTLRERAGHDRLDECIATNGTGDSGRSYYTNGRERYHI